MKFIIEHRIDKIDEVTDWLLINIGPDLRRELGHWIGEGWDIRWYGKISHSSDPSRLELYELDIKDPIIASMALLKFKS